MTENALLHYYAVDYSFKRYAMFLSGSDVWRKDLVANSVTHPKY